MKSLMAACVVSGLTMSLLVALFVDRFWAQFLNLPRGLASTTALSILAVNLGVLGTAIANRHPRHLSTAAILLSLPQVGVLLMTS